MTYTGQLMGGPDHGNLVEAGGTRIKYISELRSILSWPNGLEQRVQVRTGSYHWNPEMGVFVWTGWSDEVKRRQAALEVEQLRRDTIRLQRQNASLIEELRATRRAAQRPSDRVF